jgi:hypothetical protein
MSKRISPGTVLGVTALLVALGGTSYAALSVPKNSVGTKQLKNGAVTSSKLHRGAVTGTKVANNSLTGQQINAATLGTVPNATHAAIADSATNATHAGTADNATTLQGMNPSGFIQGSGRVIDGRLDLASGASTTTLINVPGVGEVTSDCPGGAGSLVFRNNSGATEDISHDIDGSRLVYAISAGTFDGVLGTSSGHTIEWQIATRGSTPSVTTITAVYSGSGPAACTTFAQAVTGT